MSFPLIASKKVSSFLVDSCTSFASGLRASLRRCSFLRTLFAWGKPLSSPS